MRLGIISDTHGLLRPEVFDIFAEVDHILHAGDVGPLDILTELEALAPVSAVYGNTDDMEVRSRLPQVARVMLEGFEVIVTHGDQFGSPTPERLQQEFPESEIIIYGHTHKPLLTLVDLTDMRRALQQRDQAMHFISHDIRAPNASILTLLEMQRAYPGRMADDELLRRIERYAHASLGMAESFVQLASAQAQEYRMAPIDLVALLAETTGFVDRRLLDRMKPNATFINTARGGLVREGDLVEFLATRPDVQAILDVTDPEPPATDSPLYDLPNVVLTPHIAGSIGPECRRMGRAMVEEFQRYARGETLRYGVDREQLARMA